MISRSEIKNQQQQAYYDYITSLLLCGEYQEAYLTPYNLSIREILKRCKYHLQMYDEKHTYYYEIFAINYQQYVYEKNIWTDMIRKYLPIYTEIRRRYGN